MNVIKNPAFTGLFNVNPVTLDSPLLQESRVPPDKNNWSPSVGLAYASAFDRGPLGWLLGNRKSSIRMGYGIGYDSYNITSNMAAVAPQWWPTIRHRP